MIGRVADPLVDRLRAAGCVFAEEAAGLLRATAIDPTHLDDLVTARCAGRPLETLVGWAEVDGVRVPAVDGVFVPRRRSGLLVRLVAAHLAAARPSGAAHAPAEPIRALDLCCGSGALGLALARRLPGAEVHAADLDPAAVAAARRHLPADRVHAGDLFAALPSSLAGTLDAVLVNAPYVPSEHVALMPPEARDHEPLLALDGGPDGTALHARVAAEVVGWLRPGGVVAVETSRAQAATTADLLRRAGLAVTTHHDPEVDGTAAVGVRPPSGPADGNQLFTNQEV